MAVTPAYLLSNKSESEVQGLRAHVDLWPSAEFSQSVTTSEHPRERDTAFVDHAYESPIDISLAGFVSDVLTSGKESVTRGRLSTAWETLQRFLTAKMPLQVVTLHAVYDDMLIVRLDRTESRDTGYSLDFRMVLRQVRFADAERTEVDTGYGLGRGLVSVTPPEGGQGGEGAVNLVNVRHQRFNLALRGFPPSSYEVVYHESIAEWGLIIRIGGAVWFTSPPYLRLGEVARIDWDLDQRGGRIQAVFTVIALRSDAGEVPPAPYFLDEEQTMSGPWGYSHEVDVKVESV